MQAQSIINDVAFAVEGLAPENVSLTDTLGTIYRHESGIGGGVVSRLDYELRKEMELVSSAESILVGILGPGKAIVRIDVEMDFTGKILKEEFYDPESSVKESERISTRTGKSTGGQVAGVAGVDSNTGRTGVSGGRDGEETSEEEIDIKFATGKTTQTTEQVPGDIKRLTVAAAVDLSQQDGETEISDALDQAKVEAIIKQAVGFDASRGDTIEVTVSSLLGMADAVPSAPEPSIWEQIHEPLEMVSLGLAALVACVFGLLVLRRLKPVVIEKSTPSALDTQLAHRVSHLSRVAQDDPDAVAKVLSAWLDDVPAETEQAKREVA